MPPYPKSLFDPNFIVWVVSLTPLLLAAVLGGLLGIHNRLVTMQRMLGEIEELLKQRQ
jgi:hypothetical protein